MPLGRFHRRTSSVFHSPGVELAARAAHTAVVVVIGRTPATQSVEQAEEKAERHEDEEGRDDERGVPAGMWSFSYGSRGSAGIEFCRESVKSNLYLAYCTAGTSVPSL